MEVQGSRRSAKGTDGATRDDVALQRDDVALQHERVGVGEHGSLGGREDIGDSPGSDRLDRLAIRRASSALETQTCSK